ncbi:MAG: ABC transporter permease subunit [Verrucomicrobia bacterium]|nr:ABC transporter permease subunit [Verrucomicrobiota bacterium]
MNWTLLSNSLIVSVATTLASVSIGFLAAAWLCAMPPRGRSFFLWSAVATLALPPFLVTNCWLDLLGNAGRWRGWLPLNIFSLPGTIGILALLTWPISLLLVFGACQRIERTQLESEPALKGLALLRWLVWPQAKSAAAQAAVVTFVLALNNFAVPALLQTKVYPAELWVSFNTTFDYAAALRTCVPLVAAPLFLVLWFRHRPIAWPRRDGGAPSFVFRRQLGETWFGVAGLITVAMTFLALGLPLAQLVCSRKTWVELWPTLAAGQTAVGSSLLYAFVTASVCVVAGLVGWRWRRSAFLWILFFVPGVLIGIFLIAVLNRPPLVALYQSAFVVIVAFALRYVALTWNGTASALRGVDSSLTDAARLEGAGRWQLLRFVQVPQIAPQLATVWYVTYLLCLWDVETLVLVVPPGGETLAVRIFNLLHYGHNSQVNALCLWLLALALAPLIVWHLARAVATRRRVTEIFALLGAAVFLTGCDSSPNAAIPLGGKIFSEVKIIGGRGVTPGLFNKPRSLALDTNDNLYVVDMTGRVQKFSPDGIFLKSWQMPQTDLGKPKGMACDRDGNVIVIEPHYQRVNHFSPDGRLVAQWGAQGTNDGQLVLPRAVAVNSRGEIFVSEYTIVDRVQRFSPDGKKWLGTFGHTGGGAGEMNRPEGLGIDAADRIYVADSCNHRIQIFSPDGKFLRSYGKAGNGRGELSYPYDVRVDAAGRQYVCEFGNSRLQIFDAQDRPLEILGGPGARPGEFSNPWSIALDSKGNLYVADSLNHRVQKFFRRQTVAARN